MWLSALSEVQRQALMRLAHNVVVSDGLLDPNEEGMLAEFSREMELSNVEELEYLELEGIADIFDSRRSRVIALLNLLKLSAWFHRLFLELLYEVLLVVCLVPCDSQLVPCALSLLTCDL